MSVDVIAIKDELKKYKARAIEVEKENKRLTAELHDTTTRNAKLKTEFNILGCMEEIRFHDNVLDAAEAGDIVFDKKFREANAKLEIQILNEEIRQVIPKLEAEAGANEAAVKRLTRQQAEVSEELNMFPTQYLIESDEAQRKIDLLHRRKIEIEDRVSNADKSNRHELQSLRSNNDKLRVQIATASEENIHTIAEGQRLKHQVIQEKARIDYLASEIKSLRKMLNNYHEGKGWQTEAFMANTGSKKGTLDVALIKEVLSLWIPPGVDLSESRIESIVGSKRSLTLSDFVRLCDSLS
jgi:hypothetical protein